jgi:hypothetical protein
MGDTECNLKLQNNINKYSSFNKDNIDDYIDIGNNIILLIYNKSIQKNTFALYCRNYCNFLINHTDFNYLLEVHSNINSEIIHNFNYYILEIPKLIQINNILLNLIKTNYSSTINVNLNLYEWVPLKEYAYSVKNIKNDNSYIFKFGDLHHMRIWVDILILQERFKKLENKKKFAYDVALYDLFRFFNWISYRLSLLLKNKVKGEPSYGQILKKIEYYNKQLQRNIKKTTKINYILEASGVYHTFLKKEPELKDILPKEDRPSKLEFNPNIIVPTVITVGTVLISGLIYKAL